MFEEESWKTALSPKGVAIDFTKEIVIRKSIISNLLTSVLSVCSLILIIYISFSGKYDFGILNVLLLLGFVPLTFFSLKALVTNSRILKINATGIALSEAELIKWTDIKNTYILRRSYYFTRGNKPTIERFFLNIETVYSGRFSTRAGLRAYEITGLELTENEISHIVESYRLKFT